MKPFLLRLAIIAMMALPGPARSGEPNWPDHLTIGTASPGGTYYVYGEGLAKILTRVLELPVTMLPTEGPAQNIELLEGGEAKIGFVTMGIALHAWNATGGVGKPQAGTRHAGDLPHVRHAVPPSRSAGFGIRSIAEMAGKRVGVGPRGGTSAAYVPEFFATLKTPPTNFVFGDWSDLTAQMHNRSLDMLAVGAGVPFPSFLELEAKDKVRYVALTSDQIAALHLATPELTPSRIPAGTYPSLVRPYQTVGLYNFAVAHEDLPSDLVYRTVKAVFENHEELIEVHAAAAATVPANIARNTFLPLHPGHKHVLEKLAIA